jgi:hypothetical protein
MKRLLTILLLSVPFFFTGCASSGLTASSHITNVQLTNPNFRIVGTNISGQATSKGVLGVSFGFGLAGSQMSIIPLTEDRMLYRTAMKDLWANFEKSHGAVGNRRLALVNLRYDSEALNLFFFTRLTSTVVADVVEFE